MSEPLRPPRSGEPVCRTTDDLLSAARSGQAPDWAGTINNLLTLARKANAAFEYNEALRYLNDLEDIWNRKGIPDFSAELRFELSREKGRALASLGRHEDAISEYRRILKYCEDPHYLPVRSETFAQIGQLLAKQGDYDRALGYLQRAINSYRRLRDTVGLCKALRNLGVVYVELGELSEAELTFEEAIEMARDTDDGVLHADLVNNLGAVLNIKGHWQRALKLYRESLQLYKEHSEKRRSAYTINNIAITLSDKGVNDEAFQYFQKAYHIAHEIDDASLTLIVDINLADLYLKKNDFDLAQRHCEKAEQYLLEKGLTNGHLVETRKLRGVIACRQERYEDALLNLNRALEISRDIGAHFLEAEVLLERGNVQKAMERNLDAMADLEASYRIYTALQAEGRRAETEEIIHSVERAYLEIFEAMAREVDQKDKYTKGHSDRVATLALLLAKELGLNTHMRKTIVAGALLHDVGKVKIDDAILKKDGKLTDGEFGEIKRHPTFGVELLRGKEFPWDIKPIILHHHERLDGTGYPLGLKGEDIPLTARIVCVVDVFDALTSDRIYRAAFDTETALSIMREESGTTFDPMLLSCFENLIRHGRADMVINSDTSDDEMYSIWSRCMESVSETEATTEAVAVNEGMR